jgi:hypothetical protein
MNLLSHNFVFSIPALSVAYGNIIEHKMRKNISISKIFPSLELIAALFREQYKEENQFSSPTPLPYLAGVVVPPSSSFYQDLDNKKLLYFLKMVWKKPYTFAF